MKISKWGNSLAIRIPGDVARDLGFSKGDDVTVAASNGQLVASKKPTKEELFARLRNLRGMIPADYKFKRSDAYDDEE